MRKKIFYTTILIVILFAVRFLDFAILSNLGNEEHEFLSQLEGYQSNQDEIYYEFIGFSFYEKANKELLKIAEREKEKIIVLSFYDLICPARYLIYNKEKKDYISFPWIGSEVEKGLTEVSLYKFDYAVEKGTDSSKSYFLPVVGSILVPYSYSYINSDSKNLENDKYKSSVEFNIVHVGYHFDSSYFLRKIYIIYFYAPLIIILLLLRKYKVNIAFVYFFIMTIIFHPAHFWGYAPVFGLFDHIEKMPLMIFIPIAIIIGYCYLFIKNIKKGIQLIKERELELKEKFIILYFLLLPLFLRF